MSTTDHFSKKNIYHREATLKQSRLLDKTSTVSCFKVVTSQKPTTQGLKLKS